ncbi:MAG: hypothetical protein CSB16_02615 [Clostridiales bacterium]|nr:MAG: hypothetical protein CSB16_02615 [Clostridiales bacterium]
MLGYLIVNKRRIMSASVFALLVFVLSSGLFVNQKKEDVVKSEIASGYSVYINDELVGKIRNTKDIIPIVRESKKQIEKNLGYIPDYDYLLSLVPSNFEKGEELAENLKLDVREAIGNNIKLKTKGYVMKVGNETFSVADINQVREILIKAQSMYVQDDTSIEINFEKDKHNPLVIVPKSIILAKDLPKERVFVSSSQMGEPISDQHGLDEDYFEAVVTDLSLDESIVIAEALVEEEDVVDTKQALELITKENQKKKIYKVQRGDIPATIAKKNNMTEERLYQLNEGLRENSTKIQVGQELTVTVPEPELTVTTEEKVIYTERIEHENDYVSDDSKYVGTHEVLKEGEDGLLEVRAIVKKVNGKVISKEIIEETVVKKPVRGKLTKGTRRLPITTATGTFEWPVLHFRFTSAFGYRWGRLHKGIDLANSIGTTILASDGGRVVEAGWSRGFGNCITISHGNGYTTKYAHLSKIEVEVGQDVAQYQRIGRMGNTGNSTGPHLHFEIRINDVPQNPMKYLK